MTPEATIRHLEKMAEEARRGGLYLKAAKIYHQAGELAQAQHDERARVSCLLWEGHSLSLANHYDEALPVLMQAAASRSPEANPADIYNALTSALDIALERKSAAFCCALIQQTRDWLEQNQKEAWRHKLDLLTGKLELYRGEFAEAYRWFVDAWSVWRDEYPSFTAVAHLRWLCDAAFRCRDLPHLRQWVAEIESCDKKNDEWNKVNARERRLLLFRAERTAGSDFTAAADLARSIIDHWEMFEGTSGADMIPGLRALVLARRRPDVERVMARYTLNEGFYGLLFSGDERLARAREALGMAMQDDEYDVEFPDPLPPFPDAATGLQFLREATALYEQAMKEAAAEDERLETDYHVRTLHERLARAQRIRAAVGNYKD